MGNGSESRDAYIDVCIDESELRAIVCIKGELSLPLNRSPFSQGFSQNLCELYSRRYFLNEMNGSLLVIYYSLLVTCYLLHNVSVHIIVLGMRHETNTC